MNRGSAKGSRKTIYTILACGSINFNCTTSKFNEHLQILIFNSFYQGWGAGKFLAAPAPDFFSSGSGSKEPKKTKIKVK